VTRSLPDFTGVTLATDDYEPDEVERALTTISRYARDDADAGLLAEAVFGKGRKQLHHGDKPSQEWAAARREWLERCRTWMEGQGYTPYSTQIPASMQRAYVRATGDVFVPPAGTEAR